MAKKAPTKQTKNGHNSSRVAIYARVSSDEQKRQETIKTQLEECRRYAKQNGLTVVAEFLDEGVSGSVAFDKRQGGRALLSAAERGEFSLVLLWKVSRLGRADIVTHVARHALESKGVGLRSVTEPFDTSTPAGSFLFSILSASASLDRENIRANAKAGLRRVAATGKWTNGPPPYGYTLSSERRLTPHPDEAKIVQRIFREVAGGKAASRIVREFRAEGITRRGGHAWCLAQVMRIIYKETYSGVHHWKDLKIPTPPLVDKATQRKAQETVKKNITLQPGRDVRLYPLRGLLKCGFCQRSMTGVAMKSGGRFLSYYRCSSKVIETAVHDKCPGAYPPALALENLILDEIRAVFAEKDFSAEIRKTLADSEDKRDALERYRNDQQKKLADAQDSLLRNEEAFVRGKIQEASFDRLNAKLRAEMEAIKTSLQEIDEQLSFHLSQSMEKEILNHLQRMRRVLGKHGIPTPELRQQIFQTFLTCVTVSIKKGERLNGLARSSIDVQLTNSSADLSGLLPTLKKEDKYLKDAESISIDFHLNISNFQGLKRLSYPLQKARR